MIGGVVALYALGIPWLSYAAELSLAEAAVGAALYVPGDLLKATIAAAIIVAVKRNYPLLDPTR